ncbi:unnamed protein product [Bursaphelenchus okinawaensis]|uniref:TPR_REGION domain-containing protein n=1 Tax=Bursaphelenchus okinawaensis TaxID=465554 RepID=A0A811LED4_9BILA|nr:unnamed protein product [Bursaphelenchus okinawaensis]CAG9122291.1 unnamed protein product [Bursaphelenchus okinawaensis]
MSTFETVDGFLNEYDGEHAYEELKKDLPEKPSVGHLYRLAHACYIRANQRDDENQRLELLREGSDFAKQAVELDPENGIVMKWAATLVGVLAEHSSWKEKVALGNEFKKYLDKAIEKLPEEWTLLHMRGRFIYQIANLGIMERAFVSMTFQSLPAATYEMALQDLLKMEELCPGDLDNQLFIGKVYYAMGNNEKAKEWLSLLCEAEAVDAIDREHIDEAFELMEKIEPGYKQNFEEETAEQSEDPESIESTQ